MLRILPGLGLAIALAFAGQLLSHVIGIQILDLPKSPISATMVAIILGLVLRNTIGVSERFAPGVSFGLKRVLRIGIVLLGIRLSVAQIGELGLQALPIILGTVLTALVVVTFLAKRIGVNSRLGTLIAVGTSVCGSTAIVATAPAIGARDDEVCYAVACITLFGLLAMLIYPFAGHLLFGGDAVAVGLFLGTAVHDTAQVAGSGLVYQQFYGDARALDAATVTKLVRNLGMLIIIPAMSIFYHRQGQGDEKAPAWWTMVPLFVIGFALMSLLRTLGDASTPAFGVLSGEHWMQAVHTIQSIATLALTVAMASVGLGTDIGEIRRIGLKPLGIGLLSALIVGAVSFALLTVLR